MPPGRRRLALGGLSFVLAALVAAPALVMARPGGTAGGQGGAGGGAIHAAEAHVRPAGRGQRELDVALRLENRGPAVDRLLSATSPLARSVSIVPPTAARRNGQRLPAEGLTLVPGQILNLGPGTGGTPRLVLRDLHRGLKLGEVFPLELEFQRAGRLTVGVQVVDGLPVGPGTSHVKDCQPPTQASVRVVGLC